MRAPSSVTLALVAAAVGMAALVHADPWAAERAPAPMLSAQSVARRLFPELAEGELARATIELRTSRPSTTAQAVSSHEDSIASTRGATALLTSASSRAA